MPDALSCDCITDFLIYTNCGDLRCFLKKFPACIVWFDPKHGSFIIHSLCYELSLNFFNMLTHFADSAVDWVVLTGSLATLLLTLRLFKSALALILLNCALLCLKSITLTILNTCHYLS